MVSGGGDIDAQAAATGMPVEFVAMAMGHADVEVYPDNWPVVRLFADMSTQWRVGMSGLVGLDYAALPVVMDLRGVAAADRGEVFDGLRVMESAALEELRE